MKPLAINRGLKNQPAYLYALPKHMKHFFAFLSFLALLFLTACATAAPSPTPQPSPTATPTQPPADGTILAFGDSLTEGFGVEAEMAYPAQLQRKLTADGYNYEVINGGISGETSSAALSRLEWMLNTDPDIVIIETGGNDGLRGVDLDLTEQNIAEIVAAFEESGAIVILGGLQIIQNLGPEYTEQFANMYPQIAAAHPDVIFIPFILEGVAADPNLNQDDFIHPTAEGYTVMVDHIYPFVQEAIARHQETATQ